MIRLRVAQIVAIAAAITLMAPTQTEARAALERPTPQVSTTAAHNRTAQLERRTTQGDATVTAARRWLTNPRTPYCYGGGGAAGPSHGVGDTQQFSGTGDSGCHDSRIVGFDCSGLTQYAVHQATGLNLPRSANDQANDSRGTIVGTAEAGDLIFFRKKGTTRYTHVGIYIGSVDGKPSIINAYDFKNNGANGPGGDYWGVTIMPLSWWSRSYDSKIVRFGGGGGGGNQFREGDFVRVADGPLNGLVSRVAGGYLFGLTSCAPFNGCQGLYNISEATYRSYMSGHSAASNGAFVRVVDGDKEGLIARAVGSALLGLTSCEPPELRDACGSAVEINEASFDNYARSHPNIENGTFVRVADGTKNGLIARAVGSALLGLSSCAPAQFNGCGAAVNVNESSLDAYSQSHPNITDGTFVRVADGTKEGLIARAVGSALLGLTSCEPPELRDACGSAVEINEASFDNYARSHPDITNGTFVRVADGTKNGLIARAAGTALLGLTSCEPPELRDACNTAVNVNETSFDAYSGSHPNIIDGTFVRAADGPKKGLIARAAGTSLIGLTSCEPPQLHDACGAAVELNTSSIDAYAETHPSPRDGTVVMTVPSASYWIFKHGRCAPIGPAASAVTLDDGAVKCDKPRITNSRRPVLSGHATVGSTLRVDPGLWDPTDVTPAYQWLRDGRAIPGANAPRRTVRGGDSGHKLSVRVTVSREGYESASVLTRSRPVGRR